MRSYSYVLIWMSISISVILFNKWLLAFSGFPYPIALTSWHMLFCSVVGFLCVRVFKVVKSHNMTAHTYVRRVLPIGASFASFRAPPARRHSTQHAASHWPAAMAHSACTHRRAAHLPPASCTGSTQFARESPEKGQGDDSVLLAQDSCTQPASGCPTRRTCISRCRSSK